MVAELDRPFRSGARASPRSRRPDPRRMQCGRLVVVCHGIDIGAAGEELPHHIDVPFERSTHERGHAITCLCIDCGPLDDERLHDIQIAVDAVLARNTTATTFGAAVKSDVYSYSSGGQKAMDRRIDRGRINCVLRPGQRRSL